MSLIISNATPLITFARIDQMSLLEKVVHQLVIPTAVADEISVYTAGHPGAINLAQHPWIQPQSLQSRQQVQLLLGVIEASLQRSAIRADRLIWLSSECDSVCCG